MPDFRLARYRGNWAAVWYDTRGNRQRRSLGSPVSAGQQAGLEALRDFERRVSAAVTGHPQTVSEIYAAYHEDTRLAGKPAHARQETCWKALAPWFGNLEPQRVTKALCLDYTAHRRAQCRSDGTIHVELGYLRAALRFAETEGWIAKTPYVPLPQKPDPRDRYLSRDEINRLIDAAIAPHVKLFIVLAITTAGRKAAILELTWDRVDFRAGEIDLRNPDKPRTSKGRAVVPMNDTARQWLSEARSAALSNHVIEYGGRPVANVRKGIEAAARRAGIEDCTPHTLRHTAACLMAGAGVSMERIAAYLGHTDSRTTERVYAKFAPDHLRDAADAVEI